MVTGAPSRIVVTDVAPVVAGRRYPVKRVEGEPVDVAATVVADGHDELWVVLSHQAPATKAWVDVPMSSANPGLDRWSARFTPTQRGLHRFKVMAWIDHYASLAHGTMRKVDAGQDVDSELLQGAVMLESAAAGAPSRDAELLRAAASRLRGGETIDLTDPGPPTGPRRSRCTATACAVPMPAADRRSRCWSSGSGPPSAPGTSSSPARPPGAAARPRPRRRRPARCATSSNDSTTSAISGFDILYLPPIHPIGQAFRKGPNNAPVAGPDDPGSPWAIGGADGGHTAVHPDLGTLDDVRDLAAAAAENGIELALDLAFQCSPDHPWVTEHPDWFRHRPDGTIQYAENPPKKYQDIYPLDFESPAWLRAVGGAPRRRRVLDRPRRHRVPGRQPPHQALRVLGVADRARPPPPPRGHLPGRGVHPARGHAPARPVRVHPVVHVLHVAGLQAGARRVRHRGLDRAERGRVPRQLLAHHARHPPVAPPGRAARGVRRAPRARRHPLGQLRRLRPRLRARRQPAGRERQGGVRSTPRSTRSGTGTSPGPSLREQIAQVNRIRNEQLALHTTRTLRFHGAPTTSCSCYSKTAHAGPDTDPAAPHRNTVLCVVNLDPRARPGRRRSISTSPLSASTPTRPYQVHDLLSDQSLHLAGPSTPTSSSIPANSPRTSSG